MVHQHSARVDPQSTRKNRRAPSRADTAVSRLFPEELRREFGNDAERYINYYRENLEFLCPNQGQGFPLAIDEDVKSLGMSNRKVDFSTNACPCSIGASSRTGPFESSGVTRPRALPTPRTGGVALSHRDQLFFTDVGGFKFMIAPRSMRTAASTATTFVRARLGTSDRMPGRILATRDQTRRKPGIGRSRQDGPDLAHLRGHGVKRPGRPDCPEIEAAAGHHT